MIIEKDDINLSKLARQTGYTLSHVSRVFGGTRCTSIKGAKAMAAAIGITLDQFVELLEEGIVEIDNGG